MLKSALRALLRNATGYDIHKIAAPARVDRRFSPSKEEEDRWIKDAGVGTVIDIGAHSGDFSRRFRSLLPNAKIYAFEPLPGPFGKLVEVMEQDGNFEAFNCALGSAPGVVEMRENEFSYSSSLLAMADRHREEFPFTAQSRPISVDVKRLDDINITVSGAVLIKIDVQGFEEQVIEGGERTMKLADIVILETSFTELYQGQHLFSAIYERMCRLGFSYSGSFGQLSSPTNGIPLQQDAIFLKASVRSYRSGRLA